MNEFSKYFTEVYMIAYSFGYSGYEIKCFTADIQDCYDKGYTVEECVEEVF